MSKASNLYKLREVGFRVPPFVVISAQVFDEFCSGFSGDITADEISKASLSDSLAGLILKSVHQLPDTELAVRSSLADEDSARHSFAGQLDSFLNIRGTDALLTAVKACWTSAYGERAQAYRREHHLPDDRVKMEVIVQVMVPAEISGVIFTADPVAHDPRRMLISATEGLGEALVQGETAGETSRVNRDTGEVDGQGIILKQEQIVELVSVSKKIEELFNVPQDIEFAIAQGNIFILQARPITTPIFTERILWDNSNITESYSGVTTPLTFSVIRGSYAQVYRQFLALMGVQQMDEAVLKNLLGFYNGQVYYQLLNWYEALGWLPAFDQNRRFLEQMMGVKQSAGQKNERKSGGMFALLNWGIRMIGLHLSSERRARRFLDNFNAVLVEYQEKDFSVMTPHQLYAAYLDLETRVLGKWQAPILNDFLAMIFFGVLRRLSENWLDPHESLHNDLLSGDGKIESVQPAKRVQVMAQMVHNAIELQTIFDFEPAEVLHRIRTQDNLISFRAEFDDYLRLYGDRCMNELKLEEPNLRDDPLPLLKMIAAAAKNPVEIRNDSPVRAKAETRVSSLPFLRRIIFWWVLRNARRYVRNRENLRFARSRLFGLLRGILNALGDQWEQMGVLNHSRDIYYLTIGEIWDFVEGTSVSQKLKDIIALRYTEYAEHKNKSVSLPDRFETFGIPYLDTPRDLLIRQAADGKTLQGVGCCSGLVRGRTRVVWSVNEVNDLGGEILVAERTDPGWVFLYPSASGILVERGSPLSHSAIVAREMGKPIIVNIPMLTAQIKDGDEVEMDGGRGTVKLNP